MLPTFCPPTIWTISLEFYRKPSILAADDFLGACYRKAMTPQKLLILLFLHSFSKHINIKTHLRDCPGLGWVPKICLCVFFGSFLIGGRKAHKQNLPQNPGTIPRKFSLRVFLFICVFLLLTFQRGQFLQ